MNQINNSRSSLALRAINAALWTTQVLFGIFWSLTGFGKIFWYKPDLWKQALHEVPWLSGVPQDLIIFIGLCEFLGGIGLILPALTGVKPKLTPIAAIGLTLIMIFAVVFHVGRSEYDFVRINLVLAAITAFIAYGRLFVKPIAPAPMNTFRMLQGAAVLAALVVVGYAPVWYRLTHIR
jgi:uncharacterized membrane protein YphA (DoxX/SURF4 family)